MEKKTIFFSFIGLIIGVVISFLYTSNAVNNNDNSAMQMMGIHVHGKEIMPNNQMNTTNAENMNMSDMSKNLEGKTGDSFDKVFLSEMITHHQGAVDMATMALQNAKHQEVKDLAKNIISSQNKEISEMKQWQTSWGY